MRTFLALVAITAVVALLVFGLTGCAVSLETGCSVSRTVEITRTNGQPDSTRIASARVCGDRPPPLPTPSPGWL